MDYEQKYKEALSRARVVNPGTKDYNIVTAIFPELKEDEDERIKKFISNELMCLRAVECNSGGKDSDRYKELTSAIAWLEKPRFLFW